VQWRIIRKHIQRVIIFNPKLFSLVEITLTSSLNDEIYDGLLLISTSVKELKAQEKLKQLFEHVDQYAQVNENSYSTK
jgi:hypothetical protein